MEISGPWAAPELWAYYASYDWVALCQLFGRMVDLPKGMPKYVRDLKQLQESLGSPELPKQKGTKHQALEDARWVRDSYNYLTQTFMSPVLTVGKTV